MFKKVLIANRGEIALRVHRACKEMGIRTVAVHSTADASAMHVRLADESVCIGPPSARDSYLNMAAILSAAQITGADAIHPGYGFLAERASFAEAVDTAGLTWVGPPAEALRLGGDKLTAKRIAREAGVPTLPEGSAEEIGFPLVVKASAGGGGRGMRVVRSADEAHAALESAQSEALKGFGRDECYVERYLTWPRHVEMQVIADTHGNTVWIGERDCSAQRATRSWSRSPRLRTSPTRSARPWAMPPSRWPRHAATSTPAPSSSSTHRR